MNADLSVSHSGLADQMWRLSFEKSPLALSVCDQEGKRIAVNEAYAGMRGYRMSEAHLLLHLDRSSDTDDIDCLEVPRWHLATGEITDHVAERQLLRNGGVAIDVSIHTIALQSADGDCVFLSVSTPLFHHDRMVDSRLRRALEHSQSTVMVVDDKGVILESVGRVRGVLGYPTQFWHNRNVADLFEPDQLLIILAAREQALAAPGVQVTVEVKIQAADGSTHAILGRIVNLLDDPDVGAFVLTATDITEQRQTIAELSKGRDSALAVAEQRSTLLATVSHELRNPLHAVQGLAELLASEPLPKRAAALAATLSQQLSGLAGMTQDLLQTATIDSGNMPLEISSTDLRSVLAEMVDYGRVAAGQRVLTVESLVADDVPRWVCADPMRLRQVLRNIVGNAVKFTADGAVRVDARREPDGQVAFVISDTGVGIPTDEIDKVLQPFTVGSTAGTSRGAGLGLAIVQRLVASMGGTILIESELGRGSTFTIRIPFQEIEEPHTVASSTSTHGRVALVIEDNVVNRQLAQNQLLRLGMTAILVERGEDAVRLFERGEHLEIDVILMDQQLPGIDGIETANRLRQFRPAWSMPPVIALTASASSAQQANYLAAGMDGFVSKPATLDDLRRAIISVLDQRAAQRLRSAKQQSEPTGYRTIGAPSVIFDPLVLKTLAVEFNDAAVVESLVDTFLGELPSRGLDLMSAIRAGDVVPARKAAHVLRSSARLLGANALADACQVVESGHLDDTDDVDDLESIVHRTELALVEWRAEHASHRCQSRSSNATSAL